MGWLKYRVIVPINGISLPGIGEASTRAGGRGPTETGGGISVGSVGVGPPWSDVPQPAARITKRKKTIRYFLRNCILITAREGIGTDMALLIKM
jgi:hypothetical protein